MSSSPGAVALQDRITYAAAPFPGGTPRRRTREHRATTPSSAGRPTAAVCSRAIDEPYDDAALAAVISARKNSPSPCRSVPHHQPARNVDGIVTPSNVRSASTVTPNG